MIKNKDDYRHYLIMDSKALGIKRNDIKNLYNKRWAYTKLLRKIEYYKNCIKHYKINPYYYYLRYNFDRLALLLGYEIPFNVCGEGLCLRHMGNIIINPFSKIGKNCRIYSCVNIGSENKNAPIVGNNVYIGPGVKLIGEIEIADGIVKEL